MNDVMVKSEDGIRTPFYLLVWAVEEPLELKVGGTGGDPAGDGDVLAQPHRHHLGQPGAADWAVWRRNFTKYFL